MNFRLVGHHNWLRFGGKWVAIKNNQIIEISLKKTSDGNYEVNLGKKEFNVNSPGETILEKAIYASNQEKILSSWRLSGKNAHKLLNEARKTAKNLV